MGIYSYISHRMFVAALSHDETPSEKAAQQGGVENIARNIASKIPWNVRLSMVTKTKGAARHWTVPSTPGGA